MVWFSFHGGHSGQFCRHAKGNLSEVVDAALARGFTTYGLSEHCPRVESGHLYPEEGDLQPSDLERLFSDYFDEASRLRDKVNTQMEILIGFETEALPSPGWAALMRRLRRSRSFDYIVGSVHSVNGIWIDYSEEQTLRAQEQCGGTIALEAAYFDQLTDVILTLEPEVVGHVDLIRRFRGTSVEFGAATMRRIERVLEAAKSVGACLEVNAAPVRKNFGPVYPGPQILKRAREMEVAVTLGDDSHGPADVGNGLQASLDAIAVAGYSEVHYLTRKNEGVELVAAPLSAVMPHHR